MRNSYIRTGFLSIALVLALGLSAAAQSSTTPSPQSEPASAAPAQTAPAPADSTQSSPAQTAPAPADSTQSSPAQTASPAQSSSPEAAPAQAAPAQGNSGQTGATAEAAPGRAQAQVQTAEENPLNLTDEQKAKLRPIVTEENQQMEALRNDTAMSQEQKIAKANQIRDEASPKIKAILTPEQLQKLADMQQKARQNQSAPASGTSSPQK
jgi:hypothetical protein